MIVINLYFTLYQFYCYFYINTELPAPSSLTSSTDLTSSFLSSLRDSIASTTSTDILGKTKSELHTMY